MPISCAPFVEETLITSVPRSFELEEVIELVKFILSWGENHNTGVENIGPTDVGDGSEMVGNME